MWSSKKKDIEIKELPILPSKIGWKIIDGVLQIKQKQKIINIKLSCVEVLLRDTKEGTLKIGTENNSFILHVDKSKELSMYKLEKIHSEILEYLTVNKESK